MSRLVVACVASGLVMAVAGCATQPVTVQVGPYNPEEVAWSRAPGAAVIEGQGVLRTRGGETRTCAGMSAYLVPESKYAAARVERLYGKQNGGYLSADYSRYRPVRFEPDEPKYYADVRTATCDAQGNFRFDNLPAGNWFVSTSVTWQVTRATLEGGSLMQKVSVREGETKRVLLVP